MLYQMLTNLMDAIWHAYHGTKSRVWVIGRWSWAQITFSSKRTALSHTRARIGRVIVGVSRRTSPKPVTRNGRVFLPEVIEMNGGDK